MSAFVRLIVGALAIALVALAVRSLWPGAGAPGAGAAAAREVGPAAGAEGAGAGPGARGPAAPTGAATPTPDAAAATVPLRVAIERLGRCRERGERCAAVVYLWSRRMPLSAAGVAEIERAAATHGAELLVVRAEELEALAPMPPAGLAREMLAAGATLHYPSLLVYRAGHLSGDAILGFKRADGYGELISRRLASPATAPARRAAPPAAGPLPSPVDDTLSLSVELPAEGYPGAYFRAVIGRRTLVYEASSVIHLLDLKDGSTATAPGTIDFVPSPDGRIFVTPGRNGTGLEFYDAAEVFAAAERGEGRTVRPVYVDQTLRDQYPSVGVLRSGSGQGGVGGTTVYRVLTSWFDGIVFRDFEVRDDGAPGTMRVRPLGDRTPACRRVSIPILSPDGRELAGRDETSGSTRIYRVGEGERCEEVRDLGLPTGKVAWSPDGRRLAFAIPGGALRDGSGRVPGGDGRTMSGIFVHDREGGTLRRVPGSEDAHRLSFPEFVGRDSLVYLIAPAGVRRPSVFRLVCCVN